ncbi:MAG: hypothetical protein AAF361_09590, partial [Bacteroidota bacterium]
PVASTPEWLNKSVLQTFREQTILQQYVKGNSQRKVRLHFRNKDADTGYESKTDVLVQIPNGALGLSAFLMIMVNYLRNSIKYAPYQQDHRIDLILSVQAVNKSKKKIGQEKSIRSKRLLEVTLHDRVERKTEEARDAALYINEMYIKRINAEGDEFNLAQEGLGFAEMVAAARYLRKRPFGNSWLDTYYRDEEFLEAIVMEVPKNPDKAYLAIRFYLKRPRPLLIIDDASPWHAYPDQIEFLNRMGIKLRFKEQLRDWEQESFSHELGVVLDGPLPEKLQSVRAFTPRLVYPEHPTEFRKLLQGADVLEMVNQTWEIWLQYLRKRSAMYDSSGEMPFNRVGVNTGALKGKLVFDDHAKWVTQQGNSLRQNELNFYEFYRSETPTGLLMQHLSTDHSSIDPGGQGTEDRQEQRLTYLLEEAALTKVVIIDERIQQMLKNQRFGKEVKYVQNDAFTYLQGMGVWVPNPQQADHPNFDDPALFRHEQEKLIRYLNQFTGEEAADFLVIHIGLIETMLRKTRGNPVKEWIETYLPENGRTEYVIISGRGKPLDIPQRFRYLPYNNVSLAVLKDCPSKYHICQSLYNARTRN